MIALRNASIRAKLLVGLGLALGLIVLVGGAGLYNLQTLDRSAVQTTNVWLPRIELLGEIKAEMSQYGFLAHLRLHEDTSAAKIHVDDRIRKISQKLERDWKLYEAIPGDAEEALLYSVLRDVWNQFEIRLARPVDTNANGGDPAGPKVGDFALLDHAIRRIDMLITYSNRRSNEGARQVETTYLTAFWLTVAAIVIATFGVLTAIFWFGSNVIVPIRRVSEAMRRLNTGDASATVAPGHVGGQEIGDLIEAAKGYRESLIRGRALAAEVERDRQRFFSAVDNMPVGLAMFDRDRNLIVANPRYADIYLLPPEMLQAGTPFRAIVEHRMQNGRYPGSDADKYADYLERIVGQSQPFKDVIQFHDGRIVSLIYQPMPDGGWVSTHEDITDRRKAEAKIAHMTYYDALTDLPNRTLLRERIDDALARGRRNDQVAILCLDLDHFKDVNDTLGHPIGDALLVAVAKRLASCLRSGDTVARLGGDEFAIVQVGVQQPQGARALAQRVIDAASEPYLLDGHRVITGASVGIALAPADGVDANHLLKAGDIALYRAKADGRGIYRFFERSMDARMQARRALEFDLRQAIETEAFELAYQPQVNLETNAITGFEALVRWHDRKRGTVQPAGFIPLAEETGLIEPIGEWVLKRACADAARWPTPVNVAVNLSAAQFRSRRLLQSVVTALAASGLPANRLELEITESVLLVDSEATLETLHRLRAMGVRIAMDDFGTGYSSLSYLQSFPFDKIKIDRRFITDINSDGSSLAIIRAVTGLSASLGIVTTAEGVETPEQFERVRAEGCNEVQGFLTGPPMPFKEAVVLLQRPGNEASAA